MSDVYHLLILFFLIISKESFSSNECFLECKISTLCEQSCPDGLFYLISSTTMTINVTSCPIENTNRTSIFISPTFFNSPMITTDGFVTNTFETDTSTLKHQEKTTTMDHSTIDNTTKSILTSSFGNIAETTIFSNTLETPSLSLFEIENMTESIITSNFGSKVDTSIFSSTLETFSLSLFENISSPKIRTPYSENLEGSRLATSISSIFNFSEAGITFSSDILFSGSSSKKDTNKSSSEIKGKIVMSLSGTTNFMKSETKNIMLNFTDDIVMELESNMLTPTPSSSIYSSEILEPFHTIIYHLCVEKCPDGYYANETNERCISCRDVCTNCSASDSLQRNCACNVTNSIDELCSDVDVKSSIALVTIIIVCIASVLVFLGVIVVVLCVLRKKRRLERKNSHVSESGIEIIAINECVQFDKDTSDSRYFRGSTLTVQELSYSKDSSRSRYIRDPTLTIQAETHSREEGSYDYAVKRSVNPPYDDAHGETDKSEQGYHYATARSLNATIRNEDNSYKTNTLFITPFIMSENSTDINIRHSKGNESKSTSLSSEFDLGKKYHCIDYVDIAQHNTKGTESYQKRFNNSYERTGVDFVSSEMTSTCNLNSSTSESEHSVYSNSVVINWYGKPDPIYDSCDYTDSDSCNSVVDDQLEQTSDKDRSAKSSEDYENLNNYYSDSCNSVVDNQLEQTSDKDRSAKSSNYENVNNYDSDSCNSLVDDQLEQTSDKDRSAKSSEEDYENVNNYDSDSCNSLVDDQLEQTSDIDRSAKSSEEDYENFNNYGKFATLDVICDGMNLLCFVDRRLQMKYHQRLQISMSSTNKTVNELFYSLDDQSNEYNIQSEYLIISSLMKHQYQQHLDQEILLVAVEKKLSFVCRWLLSHFHYEDECIVQVLSKSFEMGNNDIIKALAWKVTRQFYKKYKVSLDTNAIDIYPAFKCECHNTRTEHKCLLVSNKLIAIEWNGNYLPRIPSSFLNFGVKIFSYDDLYSAQNEEDEMKEIMSKIKKKLGSSSSRLSMQQIDGEVASTVFKQHRNLSLICPTIIKSKNYGYESHDHNLLQMHCIQLFCHRKGYIPLGENHFPSTINGIPTDILQGQGYFASTTLRIGDKIGTKTTCGTLGGFYRFGGKLKCFLTCAHVLYSLSTLLSPKDYMCHNEEVDVFLDPEHSQRQCGSAIRGVFKHGDSSRTSVDAGLVLIEPPDFIIDPSDILRVINGPPQPSSKLGLSSTLPFVNQNFCDHTMLCCTRQTVSVAAPGAVTKKEENVTFERPTQKDVHFQDIGRINGHANGRAFQPLLIAEPAHMQLPVGSLTDKRIFTMYNQMVMNIPLQRGDSGTCIYITGNTPQNTGCVGMAIAFCSGSGYSLVTPIQEIICAING